MSDPSKIEWTDPTWTFRGSGKDTRFKVSDSVRQDISNHLLELNHQRHAEEEGAESPGRGKDPTRRTLF